MSNGTDLTAGQQAMVELMAERVAERIIDKVLDQHVQTCPVAMRFRRLVWIIGGVALGSGISGGGVGAVVAMALRAAGG